MKRLQQGESPDYRFSLANERTFLAWIRTALGFLAAGVALEQLSADFATPVIREYLSIFMVLLSGVLSGYSYFRWLANEHAMRLKRDLRYSGLLKVLAIMMLLLAGSCLFTPFHVQ